MSTVHRITAECQPASSRSIWYMRDNHTFAHIQDGTDENIIAQALAVFDAPIGHYGYFVVREKPDGKILLGINNEADRQEFWREMKCGLESIARPDSPTPPEGAPNLGGDDNGPERATRQRGHATPVSPSNPASRATPDWAREAAKEIAKVVDGWFTVKTSGENCMNTLVDVFTEMRQELEDGSCIVEPVTEILRHHSAHAASEREETVALLKRIPLALHQADELGPCLCSQCQLRRDVRTHLSTLQNEKT